MTKKQIREHKASLRSTETLAAILRNGAGVHKDRRQRRQNRQSWRKEVA